MFLCSYLKWRYLANHLSVGGCCCAPCSLISFLLAEHHRLLPGHFTCIKVSMDTEKIISNPGFIKYLYRCWPRLANRASHSFPFNISQNWTTQRKETLVILLSTICRAVCSSALPNMFSISLRSRDCDGHWRRLFLYTFSVLFCPFLLIHHPTKMLSIDSYLFLVSLVAYILTMTFVIEKKPCHIHPPPYFTVNISFFNHIFILFKIFVYWIKAQNST